MFDVKEEDYFTAMPYAKLIEAAMSLGLFDEASREIDNLIKNGYYRKIDRHALYARFCINHMRERQEESHE